MRGFIKLIVLVAFLISSSSTVLAQEGYTIDGEITGFPDGTVIVLSDNNEEIDLDSAYIFNDSFHLSGQLIGNAPSSLNLIALSGRNHYSLFFLIGNEKVKIEGDKKNFPYDLKITGSIYNDEREGYVRSIKELNKSRYLLSHGESNYYGPRRIKLDEKRHKEVWDSVAVIDIARNKVEKDFIINNFNTYAALSLLSNDRTIIPKDSLRILYNTLDPELKESKWGNVIKVFFEEEIVRKGDDYYDFEALNQFGDTVKLSELMDDRFIFLDFGTAYCGACLSSVEELRQITRRYKNKVRVVRFSVDANKETWLRSEERKDMPSISLWEGKGTFGDVALKYAIRMFPTYFIIDPSGKIIDKGTGYGKGGFIQALSDNDIIDTKKK